MRFTYSVVRFVPDPGRGEFINIGAIVGSEVAGEWDVRQVDNLVRARHLDDKKALSGAMDFLDEVGRRIDNYLALEEDELDELPGSELPSDQWLEDLSLSMRNIVQLSPPVPVSADTLEDAMAMVFDELIVDPRVAGLDYRRRTRAQSALRAAYQHAQLKRGSTYFEKVLIEAQGATERLDFVVANGRAVQLAQAWSFEVPKQPELARRVRAWGWTMSKLRSGGGRVVVEGRPSSTIPSDIDLEVVYVPPVAEDGGVSAFDEALAVFSDIGANPVPIEHAEDVGARAADLIEKAG